MYTKILESFILPIGDFLNNSSYYKQLKHWRKLDTFSEEKLTSLQNTNLKAILEHAVANVPKYQSINLEGNDLKKWLKSFPILTKHDIKHNPDNLISKKHNKEKLIAYSSSGSSGIQSTVYMNKKEQSIIRAILTHWWEWSGYKIGNPIVQTGMSPKRGILKTIKDKLFKTEYLTAFSLTKRQLENLFLKLKNKKNHYLAGYASSLNILAEYALDKKLEINFNGVISFGDKLFSHYKKNLENAFCTKVFDTYGCNEGFLIASQKDLDYKYIMTPHVYLEILDDNGNEVEDGTMGHVVVTRLDCFSMPLIRYKIGDLAIKLPKEKYPKTRAFNYPLLEKIIGRDTDVVLLRDNKKLTVHSFTGIFEYIPEISQFQILQEKEGEIVVKYIKADNFTADVLTFITKELQKYIKDETFIINYMEVDKILPSKSGKPQIVISLLKK